MAAAAGRGRGLAACSSGGKQQRCRQLRRLLTAGGRCKVGSERSGLATKIWMQIWQIGMCEGVCVD